MSKKYDEFIRELSLIYLKYRVELVHDVVEGFCLYELFDGEEKDVTVEELHKQILDLTDQSKD